MNRFDIETQVAILNGLSSIADFAANWFLQSTILIAVGLLIGRVLRRRGSAVQSLVYRTTLVAVLACPLATMTLSAFGVSGWSLKMPMVWELQTIDSAPKLQADRDFDHGFSDAEPAISPVEITPTEPTIDNSASSQFEETDLARQETPLPESTDVPQGLSQPVAPANNDSIPDTSTALSTHSKISLRNFGALAIALSVAWILITLALLSRLGMAWLSLNKLKRGATIAGAQLQAHCDELSDQMEVSSPSILRSPFIPSPCLAGIWKPAILLPEKECDLSIQDLLVHELAHLRRHDCHWNLLRQVATAVFFFQPLIWLLSRKIEVAAEEVCDDFVVQFGGDRVDYANQLVDIAELSSAPVAPAGVGIVSFRSMLTQRVIRIMDTSRSLSTHASRMLLVSALACGLVGTGVTGFLGLNSKPIETENSLLEDGEKADAEAANSPSNRFAGQVVDPDGNPAADAMLYLVFYQPQTEGLLTPSWKPVATTDRSGSFDFTVDTNTANYHEFKYGTLVAIKDGFGFGWMNASLFDPTGKAQDAMREKLKTTPEEYKQRVQRMLDQVGQPLRLVKDDQAIEGRIVNIEGHPVIGAKLTLLEISGGENDNLKAWNKAANEPKADYYSARTKTSRFMNGPQVRSLVRPATTDDDGRFRLSGIGTGRIAQLLVEGPGIASEKIFVRSEPGKVIELLQSRQSPDLGKYTYYANQFTYIAAPTAIITGTVRDKESGAPLSGVTIKSQSRHGTAINGWGQDFVRAVTDEHGKYRLNGMPIGDENRIAAIAPQGATPYLSISRSAQSSSPNETVQVDFELHRGVWVEGKVTDKVTGKGVSGWIGYHAGPENPNAAATGYGRVDLRDRMVADQDGQFKVAVVPGLGYLTFMAHDHMKYARTKFIAKADGTKKEISQRNFAANTGTMIPFNSHSITEINPEANDEKLALAIQLDSSGSLSGRVVGPGGRPVKEFFYTGHLDSYGGVWERSKGGTLELVGYDEAYGRIVFLVSKDRKLAGNVQVHGKQNKDIVVKLQPAGSARGRLVDQDGEPVANCQLTHWRPSFNSPMEATSRHNAPPLPINVDHWSSARYETDDKGHFEIKGLVAGVEYRILARLAGMTDVSQIQGPLESVIKVKPGEEVDLGDVKIGDEDELLQQLKDDAAQSTTTPAAKESTIIAGTVFGQDKKPVAGAEFYWMSYRPRELESVPPKLIATSDKDGKFSFRNPGLGLPANAPARWDYKSWIVVRAEGHGFITTRPETLARQMKRANSPRGQVGSTIAELKGAVIGLPDAGNPLRGRIVDIDGKAVAGAKVRIKWFHRPNRHRPHSEFVSFEKLTKKQWTQCIDDLRNIIEPPQAIEAFPGAITDSNGQFEIRNVGENRLFQLVIEGERIEQSVIIARNAPGKKLTATSDYYRKGQTYEIHPQEILHVVGPSIPVTGKVVDDDTGEPIPNAMVMATMLAGTNSFAGYIGQSLRTRTDAEGNYQIHGLPIGRDNRVVCICPDSETAYPITGFQANTSNVSDVLKLDIRKKSGVWAEGRVFDSETSKPMTGGINYYIFRNPELEARHPGIRYSFLQFANWTDMDGRFRIPVWPTRGILAYRHDPATHEEAMQRPIDRYPRGAGADEIEGKDERMSSFPTYPTYLMATNYRRVIEVNPAAGQDHIVADMPMFASKSLFARPIWPDGITVENFQAYGANENWGWERFDSPEFEIRGVRDGEQRKVFVFNRKLNLVGMTIVDADSANGETIKIENIQSAGIIEGRFVDDDGQPVTDATLHWNYESRNDLESGVWAPHPGKMRNPSSIPTDKDGRFRLTGIVPGMKYTASATAERKMYSDRMMPTHLGTLFSDVTVGAGETKQLGDVRVGGDQEDSEVTTSETKTKESIN